MAPIIFTFAALCSFACAAVRSGKAEVEWISSSTTYESGKPVQMAIRLKIDPGWHSYWSNPGAGGMKTSVKWELPSGWTAGELENPLPKRFNGGGLAGFGYSGAVIFPVKLIPPAETKGTVHLKAKVSWLTCDDQACVPGNAELSISLDHGLPKTTTDNAIIEQSLSKIPRKQRGWGPLEIIEKDGHLEFKIPMESHKTLNPVGYDVFPLTPDVIDAAYPIKLTAKGNEWTAIAPKCEFNKTPVREMSIVIAPKSGESPVLLNWKIH